MIKLFALSSLRCIYKIDNEFQFHSNLNVYINRQFCVIFNLTLNRIAPKDLSALGAQKGDVILPRNRILYNAWIFLSVSSFVLLILPHTHTHTQARPFLPFNLIFNWLFLSIFFPHSWFSFLPLFLPLNCYWKRINNSREQIQCEPFLTSSLWTIHTHTLSIIKRNNNN